MGPEDFRDLIRQACEEEDRERFAVLLADIRRVVLPENALDSFPQEQPEIVMESAEPPASTIPAFHEDIFDIFSGPPDRDALWVEAVDGIDQARRRMREIVSQNAGPHFIFHARTGVILDIVPFAESKREDQGRSKTDVA